MPWIQHLGVTCALMIACLLSTISPYDVTTIARWWLGLFDANDGNCGNVPSASRQFVFQKNSTLMLGPGGQGVPADRICIHSGPVPNTGNAVQVWIKPLPGGAVAVFAFNSVFP